MRVKLSLRRIVGNGERLHNKQICPKINKTKIGHFKKPYLHHQNFKTKSPFHTHQMISKAFDDDGRPSRNKLGDIYLQRVGGKIVS